MLTIYYIYPKCHIHVIATAAKSIPFLFSTSGSREQKFLKHRRCSSSFLLQVQRDGSQGITSHSPRFFCVSAVLKDAVQNWPHSDPVSWAQRASTVALIRRLDRSIVKAKDAVKRSDSQYFRGEKDDFNPKLSQLFLSASPHLRENIFPANITSVVAIILRDSHHVVIQSLSLCCRGISGCFPMSGPP